MLELGRVGVRIGSRDIVSDVSFTMRGGQCLGILGRNGAGKSTLVRGLAGLLPTTGTITLDGQDLAMMDPVDRGRAIGYVPQYWEAAHTDLSVLELLILTQNTHAIGWRSRGDALARAQAIIESLNLEALAHRSPSRLSGGQKQMVALSLALVHAPRLLLLDEPTSALDMANQFHLLRVVRDYTQRAGIATLMVVHDLNLVTRYADRALMLESGRVAIDDQTDRAFTRENLARIYGVDCHITTIAGYRVIYPIEPL